MSEILDNEYFRQRLNFQKKKKSLIVEANLSEIYFQALQFKNSDDNRV